MTQLAITCNRISGGVMIYESQGLMDEPVKMQHEAVINASRDFVWAAFDNPANLARWQPTLQSFKHKSGQPGQPGAITELVYDENGRMVVMTETVAERRQPHFLAGVYDTAWARTLIVNHFQAIDDNRTRLVSYSNMSFKGMMKFVSLFSAGSIRRRLEADMNRFKLFVESEAARMQQ